MTNTKIKPKHNWLAQIFLLSFSLGLAFSTISGIVLNKSGLVISVLIVVFFITLSIVADIIGVAMTACEPKMFLEDCKNKVAGAKEAMFLARNADKIASIMCDVVGDICGILSGSAGSGIVLKILTNGSKMQILLSVVFSAFIASVTIFGKAVGKNYAISSSKKIALNLGKIVATFFKKSKSKPIKKPLK